MIFHLAAAGTPVSWRIVALYKSSYGVAHRAADGWYKDNIDLFADTQPDQPQFIVEMDGSDETGWTASRPRLWMMPYHLGRQTHDEPGFLLQTHSAALPLSDALGEAVTHALKAALVEFGYMIPRDEYTRRYPSQVLISKRFAEFRKAYETAEGLGEPLPFDSRWAPFMDVPADYHLAYSTGYLLADGSVAEHDTDGAARPVIVTRATPADLWTHFESDQFIAFPDVAYVKSAARLLNSGWTPEEVGVLLAAEPVTTTG